MVPGCVPFKILSDSPALHSRWLLLLKIEIPGTIPARFGLIWFSGFRGEDLNVIFYQNMPNLNNWYKSAERKISKKKNEHMLNSFKMATVTKNRNYLNGQNCSILSQNVPKFELCKHNDELFNMYYRIFYEL
jgi:hypothetical protein